MRGVELQHRRRDVMGKLGNAWKLERSGGDHHAPRVVQDTAHRKAGLAVPDDNDVVLLPHAPLPRDW